MCKLNHSQVAGLICATDSSLNGGKGLFVLQELTQAIVLFTCCQFTNLWIRLHAEVLEVPDD